MARKHNTKHNRSGSQYLARLSDRGITAAQVRMPFIDRKGTKYGTIDALRKREQPQEDVR